MSITTLFREMEGVCFKCFRGIFQVLHLDVAKVYPDVVYVASVSKVCCKRLFKMFHLFQTYAASA
jgi:hypothetical protein